MKQLARSIVAKILGYQVKRLYKKNNIKVVGVVGSIGKTSTKLAIARVLSAKYKVRYQDGNYNDLVTVPLIFFGEPEPSLYNPLAWLATFWRNQRQVNKSYPYDVVVVELGSDTSGLISEFRAYLRLDIAVITAITPEHMENFKNLAEVADEELTVTDFSTKLVYNSELCPAQYLRTISIDKIGFAADNSVANLSKPERYSRQAAKTVAVELGMDEKRIQAGLKNIKSVPGRMQRLTGLNGSIIIDDSYNASPDAMKLALDNLYETKASQKIALLGNMNEMGSIAPEVHKEIGEYCDPKKLDLVLTLGPEANQYLAPAAEAKGCKVVKFNSPYGAGSYIKPLLTKGTVVLVKGSQNKVFAEEAIKSLLVNPADSKKLVRQSPYWMAIKQKAFGKEL
jgi:UDP-N-acetylmuramoyl-tripeptide--D-alanyl-D-alanine ligase